VIRKPGRKPSAVATRASTQEGNELSSSCESNH
jgi:hypothetical protein